MIVSLIFGIILFLIVEHPVSRLLEWTILPYLSQDELLHNDWCKKNKICMRTKGKEKKDILSTGPELLSAQATNAF